MLPIYKYLWRFVVRIPACMVIIQIVTETGIKNWSQFRFDVMILQCQANRKWMTQKWLKCSPFTYGRGLCLFIGVCILFIGYISVCGAYFSCWRKVDSTGLNLKSISRVERRKNGKRSIPGGGKEFSAWRSNRLRGPHGPLYEGIESSFNKVKRQGREAHHCHLVSSLEWWNLSVPVATLRSLSHDLELSTEEILILSLCSLWMGKR
jgi:hypothetical protein